MPLRSMVCIIRKLLNTSWLVWQILLFDGPKAPSLLAFTLVVLTGCR